MTQIVGNTLFSYPFSQAFHRLGSDFYSEVTPTPLKQPYWVHFNNDLAKLLGINTRESDRNDLLNILNGEQNIEHQPTLAMVYAGHQFGGYSSELGDGRALLLAQIKTPEGEFDLQIKGAGKTPYSRFGDGRAVLRSSIREYLAGEAMHQLGIPTTRALSLIGSKSLVLREEEETGAMLARVARCHIRFGHFEYFHYTNQLEQVKQLADYVIEHFLPEAINANDKYAQLLQMSVDRTASLIAQWQSIGFAHGVMNTDNMSIIGETIDYGPYGFLDDYEPGFICNHSDHTGRYAFDQQPSIGLWNLNALAHALSSLIDTTTITHILQSYEPTLVGHYANLMRKKMGLMTEDKNDPSLCADLLALMASGKIDYTLLFRLLSHFQIGSENEKLSALFIKEPSSQKKWQLWRQKYTERLSMENSNDQQRQEAMRLTNPKFIARNYLLQNAINKAQQEQDYSEINTLFMLLTSPYDEHPDYEAYSSPPPQWGKHLPISCSS